MTAEFFVEWMALFAWTLGGLLLLAFAVFCVAFILVMIEDTFGEDAAKVVAALGAVLLVVLLGTAVVTCGRMQVQPKPPAEAVEVR